jgi:protocatechuate 3,4-dioxygenase beta subunit
VRSLVALLALPVVTGHGCKDREPTPIPATPTSREPEPPWEASSHPIAGRVLTKEGEGFAGIELVAQSERSQRGEGTATSDENGVFRFEGLTAGAHSVLGYSGGHEVAPVEHVAAGTTDLVLTLVESARVNGRVLDPSGKPLESFLVEVLTDETDPILGTVVARKTFHHSTDGVFELGGLPEGVHAVEARAEGLAPSLSEPFRTVRDSTTKGVVVRMTQGGSLAGLVLDGKSGLPIAGAEVFPLEHSWLSVATGAGTERVRVPQWNVPLARARTVVRTDSTGRFVFALLAPGPYRLMIQAQGYACVVSDEVRCEEQTVTELPPQSLTIGATITGIVHGVDGKIEPGAHVQLAPIESDYSGDNHSANADASGRFTFENVLPSRYRLSATRANLSDDPFEAIGDIRRSEIEIKVADRIRYELELDLASEHR